MPDHLESGDEEPLHLVQLDTGEGQEAVVYGPGPEHVVVGIAFVPAELLTDES
ncbi:hypothetical protein [Streptomyces sp. CS014]|uniref:hypothetical protein n=1 Tax=Streptomyces sp. CS014 TaxID=2162707 RepID=UPI0013A5510F|nr:hypothetical protein [Streptomyces sp. CS014]